MSGRGSAGRTGRWLANSRGVSPTMGAIAIVVVAIVVGAGGYFGLQAGTGTSHATPPASCQPAALCKASTGTNDVSMFTPYTPGFGQQILSVASGQQLPMTVSLTGGEVGNLFTINWGDGTIQSNTQGTFSHAFAGLGEFLIFANATVGSVVHTGSSQYFPVVVTPSIGNLSLGYFPTLSTTFVNATGGLYPWVAAGGKVHVAASYSVPPTDPASVPGAPSLRSTGGVQSALSENATSASANYTFANPGFYNITFVGPAVVASKTMYQNYTWEVYVYGVTALVPSCDLCKSPTAQSPHPGQLNFIEGGGPPIGGLDPAYDYDTVGAEPIWNIFETLVAYNGSAVAAGPTSYLPELATCVPGSAQCGRLYPGAPGTDLVVNNGTFGPQWWTFVIDKTARFYDPTTGLAQSVYPTDVMFSVARAMAYANLPGTGYYNGFILGQALLPFGNASWDNGTHFPYNNTPKFELGSMLINDTSYCPAAAISSENGCITFNAWGGNVAWPNFLQLIVDPLGGSVEECSFYVHLGVQPPGFTAGGTNVPCGLPGGVSGGTTNTTAWTTYLNTVSPTLWDTYEISGGKNYPAATPATRTVAAGSGPYRLVSANFQIGYVLQKNPYYVQPTGCVGNLNCLPAPSTIVPRVNVQWLLTDQQGIADYEAGYADLATIYPSDTTSLLALLSKGLIVTKTAPTLNIAFLLMNLQINLPAFKSLDIFPTNIKNNTFSYIGLRDFLATTIPYATVENTINTVDGIQYLFNYGGFIPQFMANYYPHNVSFPNYNVTTGQFTNPVTVATQPYSMAWYWAALTNPSSPLYDPQFGPGAGQYNPSNPLEFPLIGETGDTPLDATYALMASIISTATGGAIKVDTFDLSFSQLGANIAAPGQTGLAFWNLAWAPDYANPWDYAVPLALPDGTYTGPDAVYETLHGAYGGAFLNATDPLCAGHVNATNQNASYWANLGYVPQDCQGIAYDVMVGMLKAANANPNLGLGVTQYDWADAIFSELSLIMPDGQANAILSMAPWIDPTTLNTNIVVSGGGAEIASFFLQGNGLL